MSVDPVNTGCGFYCEVHGCGYETYCTLCSNVLPNLQDELNSLRDRIETAGYGIEVFIYGGQEVNEEIQLRSCDKLTIVNDCTKSVLVS